MSENDPAKVAENDLRKIHSEINQIVSQRFSLTTTAIVAFATICGWATAAEKNAPSDPNFLALMGMLLLLVLTALYVYFMMLRGMMRILTIYLIEKYASPWETDWQEFRRLRGFDDYQGYSVAGTLIFQFLGLLTIAFLGALWYAKGGWHLPFPLIFAVPGASFVIYEIAIYRTTKRREKDSKDMRISRHWKQVLRFRPLVRTERAEGSKTRPS